ncbi:MAG: prephenate dehydrogenase/arogenate dehydrogenase family protein [Nitrospirales bacterium]|nr:prephenate dehydrogenase/arogenate dehydrogenase family protein [Nitrospirales bacterium]
MGDLQSPFFEKIAIVGVGLLGASFALAAKERRLCNHIRGYGRKEENLRRAQERGIINDFSLDLREACEGADLVLLSTPVGAFRPIVGELRSALRPGTVVTDVGSVKGELVRELESLMPEGVWYVGSHPIAGSHKSGIDDARPDLYRNARCIVTPTAASHEGSKERIIALWESLGGRVEVMDPLRHDEIYSAVSHFPHIIAYTIVNTVNAINQDYIDYAGQGFKDTTRIALSSPEMWRDISIFNRENLIRQIGVFRENLDRIMLCIEERDPAGVERELLRAQDLRKRLQ